MLDMTMYPQALKQFVDTVQDEQISGMCDDVRAVVVYVETGRKFDRVMIAEHKKGQYSTEAKVRYFVDRKRGNIYGALSPLAPNFKWFFGDLTTVDKWDWSGFHGRPKVSPRDAGVVFVGKYGSYDHYEKITRRNGTLMKTA